MRAKNQNKPADIGLIHAMYLCCAVFEGKILPDLRGERRKTAHVDHDQHREFWPAAVLNPPFEKTNGVKIDVIAALFCRIRIKPNWLYYPRATSPCSMLTMSSPSIRRAIPMSNMAWRKNILKMSPGLKAKRLLPISKKTDSSCFILLRSSNL